MQTAAKELGIEVGDLSVEIATDSSGAKSFASRRGSGRIRHVEVMWLWLHQALNDICTDTRSLVSYQNMAPM